MVLMENTQPHFAELDAVYGIPFHLRGSSLTERTSLDQQTTVHHWQLKDLVACESSRVLYCVHQRTTVRYDTQKQRVHDHCHQQKMQS